MAACVLDQREYSHKKDDDNDLLPPLTITWGDVTEKNVKQLQVLNSVIFPIKYNDQFYKDAVHSPPGFVKLAYFNEVLVAGVCCRKEIYVPNHNEFHQQKQQPNGSASTVNSSSNDKFSLYILTLGVLAPYRERGIGRQLIEHVLKLVDNSPACKDVIDIYLHVQEGNEEALRFYHRYGFQPTEKIENYYKRLEPSHCYIVRKSIQR